MHTTIELWVTCPRLVNLLAQVPEVNGLAQYVHHFLSTAFRFVLFITVFFLAPSPVI